MGKGNSSMPIALREQLEAGAAGLKVHEDFGATPAVINCALSVADEYDVQVAIHTDTLNESGYVEDTRSAFDGRTIHTFHSEGAGGGHAPDILRVTGEPNVLPSSTNPTLPYGINSVAELLDMVMVCHHLSHDIPEDVSFAESRVRAETIAAETVLHDLGIISMVSSDSQAMGRVGETVTRAFQIAHHCKALRGALPEDSGANDNLRVLRFLAKVTINPAITNGVEPCDRLDRPRQGGRPGPMADRVVRRQAEAWSSRAGSSAGRRWAIPTRRCRPRSPSTSGRCSAPTGAHARAPA